MTEQAPVSLVLSEQDAIGFDVAALLTKIGRRVVLVRTRGQLKSVESADKRTLDGVEVVTQHGRFSGRVAMQIREALERVHGTAPVGLREVIFLPPAFVEHTFHLPPPELSEHVLYAYIHAVVHVLMFARAINRVRPLHVMIVTPDAEHTLPEATAILKAASAARNEYARYLMSGGLTEGSRITLVQTEKNMSDNDEVLRTFIAMHIADLIAKAQGDDGMFHQSISLFSPKDLPSIRTRAAG